MIYIQVIGCGIFAISSIALAKLLRKYPTGKIRESTTTILHAITLVTFFLPVLIGIFYPDLTAYDSILGISSLAYRPLSIICGVILIPLGLFFVFTSILALIGKGHGQPVFFLQKK